MNSDRIAAALREIEASVPTGKPEVRFDVYGGYVDESFIRGSREGIARLGLRLIQASLRDEDKKSINGTTQVGGALDDVIHPSSDIMIDWIEISDDLEIDAPIRLQARRSRRRETLIGVAFVLIVVAIALAWRLQ